MNSFGFQHTRTYKLLLLCVPVAFSLSGCGSDEESSAGSQAIDVRVTQSRVQDVPLSEELVGTTLGTQDVPIRARVEGFLESVDFNEGTFVEKGALLYTIDPQPFQARLVEAQSQLAAAQTNLAKADADLRRIRPLAEMKAVSEQDLDSAVAQEAAARASVSASEAAVDLANIELSYTRIHAPIEGLIGLTKAKPGEFVGREPNPVVLNTLSDIDPIRVRFSIAEREYLIFARNYIATHSEEHEDRRNAARQDDLTLILADRSEHPHKGRIVGSAQSIDIETGTYTLEAAFPNPNQLVLPGQFARVRAPYTTLRDAVVAPRKAIIELQGFYRVYIVNAENVVEVRELQLGPTTGNDVVVESGLTGGETIIVEGLQKVRPGSMVNALPLLESRGS